MPMAERPRHPLLMLRFRSGTVRPVTERRADGWPFCPACGEDELAALAESSRVPIEQWENKIGLLERLVQNIDFCYRCGDVEVVPAAA